MNNVKCSHVMYNVSAHVLMLSTPTLCIILSALVLCRMLSASLLRIMWILAFTVALRTVRLVMTKTKTAKKNNYFAVCLLMNGTRQTM
jgi:ABC-type dipeptide/oligopeptide/nickel transport system permease subunit